MAETIEITDEDIEAVIFDIFPPLSELSPSSFDQIKSAISIAFCIKYNLPFCLNIVGSVTFLEKQVLSQDNFRMISNTVDGNNTSYLRSNDSRAEQVFRRIDCYLRTRPIR